MKPGGGHCILGVAVQGGPDRGLALLKPKGGHDKPTPALKVVLLLFAVLRRNLVQAVAEGLNVGRDRP